MNDPLSRALAQAVRVSSNPSSGTIQHLNEVMPALHEQLLDVLRLPFFDAGIEDEPVPVLTSALLESGSLRMTARRNDPPYEVAITFDARTIRDAADESGRYEMLSNGVVRHQSHKFLKEREFSVPVSILADGTLRLDVVAMKAELAAIIAGFASDG